MIPWQATARIEGYDYLIRPSECHQGTFVLRIANGETNKTVYRTNNLHSVEEAMRAAEQWCEEHVPIEENQNAT